MIWITVSLSYSKEPIRFLYFSISRGNCRQHMQVNYDSKTQLATKVGRRSTFSSYLRMVHSVNHMLHRLFSIYHCIRQHIVWPILFRNQWLWRQITPTWLLAGFFSNGKQQTPPADSKWGEKHWSGRQAFPEHHHLLTVSCHPARLKWHHPVYLFQMTWAASNRGCMARYIFKWTEMWLRAT